jgi:hypothetical protein
MLLFVFWWQTFHLFPQRSQLKPTWGRGQTWPLINKHCKFSKWSWFRLDSSDMTYLTPSKWPAQIQVSLLAPITWVTACATVSQGFLSISKAMILSHEIKLRCLHSLGYFCHMQVQTIWYLLRRWVHIKHLTNHLKPCCTPLSKGNNFSYENSIVP